MKRIVGVVLVVFCLCFSIALAAPLGERSAEQWYDQGNQYFDSGEYTQAVDSYTKSIEVDPHAVIAGLLIGN